MVKVKILFRAAPNTAPAKKINRPESGTHSPGCFVVHHEPSVGIEPNDLSLTMRVLLPLSYEGVTSLPILPRPALPG